MCFLVNVTANDVCTGYYTDPRVLSSTFFKVCTVEGEKVLVLKLHNVVAKDLSIKP